MVGSSIDPMTLRLTQYAPEVHRQQTEIEALRRRMEGASNHILRKVALDRAESPFARCMAAGTLAGRPHRDEVGYSHLLRELFDDPDDSLVRCALLCAGVPPFDPSLSPWLFSFLDDPREFVLQTAAETLARRLDPRVLPLLLRWVHGDSPWRLTALNPLSWLLDRKDLHGLVRGLWAREDWSDAERILLAGELLAYDDPIGLPFLEVVARRVEGLAAEAADAIYRHDPASGLVLMQGVLDCDAPEVAWRKAERIARKVHHPHLWTADWSAEARYWIERQREALVAGRPSEAGAHTRLGC